MSKAWIYLFTAGVLEIAMAIALKMSEGFTKLVPSVVTIASAAISFYLLATAMRELPIGTGYAVWVGIGAAGTAIFGILLLGEAANALRLGGIALIIAGVALLKFADAA